jgi:hypothetical protein
MVYNTELLGVWTFPSSCILETRKHDVSETGEDTYSVELNHWTTPVRFTQLVVDATCRHRFVPPFLCIVAHSLVFVG